MSSKRKYLWLAEIYLSFILLYLLITIVFFPLSIWYFRLSGSFMSFAIVNPVLQCYRATLGSFKHYALRRGTHIHVSLTWQCVTVRRFTSNSLNLDECPTLYANCASSRLQTESSKLWGSTNRISSISHAQKVETLTLDSTKAGFTDGKGRYLPSHKVKTSILHSPK